MKTKRNELAILTSAPYLTLSCTLSRNYAESGPQFCHHSKVNPALRKMDWWNEKSWTRILYICFVHKNHFYMKKNICCNRVVHFYPAFFIQRCCCVHKSVVNLLVGTRNAQRSLRKIWRLSKGIFGLFILFKPFGLFVTMNFSRSFKGSVMVPLQSHPQLGKRENENTWPALVEFIYLENVATAFF